MNREERPTRFGSPTTRSLGALAYAEDDSGAINLPGPGHVWGRRTDGYEATARLSVLAATALAGATVDGRPPPDWFGRIVGLLELRGGGAGGGRGP